MTEKTTDWQTLLLSPTDFQTLTGVPFKDAQDLSKALYQNRKLSKWQAIGKRCLKYAWNGFWFSIIWAILLGIFVIPIAIGGFYLVRLLGLFAGISVINIVRWSASVCLLTGIPMSIWFSWDEEKKQDTLRSLLPLTQEVEKFNRLVRATDVKAQLAQASGKVISPEEQAQTIATLSQLRSELENALKVERVLRENQDVVMAQVDAFEGATLGQHMQLVTDQALEYGQVLDEALKLGDRVRNELKTLHNRQDQWNSD